MKQTQKKAQVNQYEVRQAQIQKIIDNRLATSSQQGQWIYESQVREVSSKNKYKYQDVVMSYKVDFLEDMKQIIYDSKRVPDDLNLFSPNTNWKLIGFQDIEYNLPMEIPSKAYMKNKGYEGKEFNQAWGAVILEGRLNVKINDTIYSPYHFNLRRKAILFYPISEVQIQQKQDLMIPFTQTCFNYQSENDQNFTLKFGEKVLKIKKDNDSRDSIKALERCLFLVSFRGAYCLRNQAPSYAIEQYVIKQIDTIKGADFVHENKIKQIVGSRYYRQSIGGFLYLLNKQSFKRKTLSMQITYPKWFKPHFKTLPNCQLNLITNVVPTKVPLMNLKIKLHQSEVQGLNQNLKYIFPFRKDYIKRSLIVYQSNLQDEQVNYMMRQISYPMHMIGLAKNQLSILGLQHAINAAGTLYYQIIDFSYNAKLISISGPKIFTLANANPSIKKITIKGCYILLGEEDQFFQGLSNNMCLQQFEIDYMDSYNESMIKHLTNYDAEVY